MLSGLSVRSKSCLAQVLMTSSRESSTDFRLDNSFWELNWLFFRKHDTGIFPLGEEERQWLGGGGEGETETYQTETALLG